MLKTKDYDQFKFRDDNRERINQEHVKKLIESIKSRNLLNLRPILVNEKMEILDGQHRLLAAKELNTEIYYQIEKNLQVEDIITLNTLKTWTLADYMNFHCKNGNEEYIKLNQFIKKNKISTVTMLTILFGRCKNLIDSFKLGKFKFETELLENQIQMCWNTILYIKSMNGSSKYTSSGKFWRALIKLINHEEFDEKIWMRNLEKNIYKMSVKVSEEDYVKLMFDIYNYQNKNKIQ